MSRFGVILAICDLPDCVDIVELKNELWVEGHILSSSDRGKPRKLMRIHDAETLEKAVELPQFLATAFSDGDGVWGPMNREYIRDRLKVKDAVS